MRRGFALWLLHCGCCMHALGTRFLVNVYCGRGSNPATFSSGNPVFRTDLVIVDTVHPGSGGNQGNRHGY